MFVRWTRRTLARTNQRIHPGARSGVTTVSDPPGPLLGCVTDWGRLTTKIIIKKKTDRKQKNLQNKGRKRPQVQQPQQSALNKTKLKCGYGIKKTFNILRLLHINLAVLSGDLRGIWPGWRVCVFIQPETLSSCSK